MELSVFSSYKKAVGPQTDTYQNWIQMANNYIEYESKCNILSDLSEYFH